jgi:phosphoglycolate phosphatase-like HAD superfamily hydrolase
MPNVLTKQKLRSKHGQMFGPIESVAFDFDGTLVNTMTSVARGMQKAVLAVTGKTVELDELAKTFGPAPRGVLAQWVPADRLDEALGVWLDFDGSLDKDAHEIFSGVSEMLEDLLRLKISIGLFTGRDRAGTLRILNNLQWTNRFFSEKDLVCGDDGFKAKPSGEGLLHLVKMKNWTCSKTLMVGDHKHDMMAGREAKCKTAVALWDQTFFHGTTNRGRFRESWQHWDAEQSVDLRLATPDSLAAWFRKSAS